MNKFIPMLLFGVLVAGCTATPASPQPAATSAPTAAKPTSKPTQVATVPPPATPAQVAPTAVPSTVVNRALVQLPDNRVVIMNAAGNKTPLGAVHVRLSGSPFAAAVAGDTVLGFSTGQTPGAFALNASGAQAISALGTNLVGVAVSQGTAGASQVAWGAYSTAADGMTTANLLVGRPDGSGLHPVLTSTAQGMFFTLMPLRWSAGRETLYYASEPNGLGGYIPFGGFSSLYALDIASGVTRTLVPRTSLGFICLDDLSADFSKVAYHCGDQAIHVLDTATQQTTTITIPATVKDAAALGSAAFSPTGARVAYALARRDPENEQGWLAVSEGLTGGSSLIYTSPAGAYASTVGWLDADTLAFQLTPVGGQSDATATIWAVGADGSSLRQLAEGNLLAIFEVTR